MPGSEARPPVIRTRAGVIGDIHGQVEVLAWALDLFTAQQVELVLATGDIADGPGESDAVNRCCTMLQQARVLAVSGNHDRWLLDGEMRNLPDATFPEELDPAARTFLRTLPQTREFETPLGSLLLGHGLGSDDMATLYPHDHGHELTNNTALQRLLREGRHRLVVSGHTHRRMVRVIDGVRFVNAGTLLRKREPCCLVLDFEAKRARFYEFAPGAGVVLGPSYEL